MACRNAGRRILMDLEHEPRALDEARYTADGIHFDGVEGQAWMKLAFQEQLDELEVELFKRSKNGGYCAGDFNLCAPKLETRLISRSGAASDTELE